MISDMKAAVYLLAAEKLRHGHTYYICFALLIALEELTGMHLNGCTEDCIREFFPELYKYFDGSFWGKTWDYTVHPAVSYNIGRPTTLITQGWWNSGDLEPRLALIDHILKEHHR